MRKQGDLEARAQGKQRNHGSFHLPSSIRHLDDDLPLYLAVAWWGLLRGGQFTRDDISLAFQIEPRRAGGVMNYLCQRNNGGDITFEISRRPVRGANSILALRILSVAHERAQEKRIKPVSQRRGPGCLDRLMAQWLLSRPSSCDPERFARWKAACPANISE